MVSQLNNMSIASIYAGGANGSKNVAQKEATTISKQGDMSKVDRIKESVDAGTYKVDIQALSEKIAEALL